MCEASGETACDEYNKRLVRYISYCDKAVEIGKRGSEKTEADGLWAYYGANTDVSGKTDGEWGYDCIGGAAVDSKKYQKR